MNDMTNDLTPEERDELASAYLDGEVTAQERAMVEADTDLLARVEQLRHAAEEVASPATEAGREEIIAEALKAFKPETEPVKQPEKLKSRHLRSRQREAISGFLLELRDRLRNRRLTPILGAAAALAVVFLAITFFALTSEDTGDDSDAASSATTPEFAQILESADLQVDEALSDSAAAFAPATAAASATTAAQAADFAPATTATMTAAPDPAPSDEGAFDAMTQADLSTGAEASSLEAEEQPEAAGPPPEADGPPPEADGPPQEARAQLAETDDGLDAECPEDEPAEEESPEESPEDAAEEEDDADTLPTTSLNPSSTTSSLPPEEASEEDPSDLNTDIFEDAPLAECP